jgi:DNA invertase Pin-like site-specific DNA recombinase
MTMMDNYKITTDRLAKKAIVYVRQSTFKQVIHNQESQRLQYALVERARSLGWHDVEVIDDDLGYSASDGTSRAGFKKLLSTVAMGDVGMVLSTEASRLSRTDKDWCHLLEICKVCGTLIGDAEHIYDVNVTDDQLILGIKGTLSVMELSVMKSRLFQGQEHKAMRGELYKLVAPGYLCPDGKSLVKDPNLRVQQAIALVFTKFRELWSVRQVFKWLHEEHIQLPVNKSVHGKTQLVWQLPTYHFVKYLLKNPVYAGVYVHGQRHMTMVLDGDHTLRKKSRQHRYDQARVYIKNHHEPYISWVMYEQHQQMIAANAHRMAPQDDTVASVRQGHGLLTGLLRCGRCGRKLQVRYWGKSGTAARYLCRGDFSAGGTYCLGFGGATVDRKISEQVLEAISPLALEASLKAAQSYEEAQSDTIKALRLQIQQVDYEATRAFEQYDQVDPKHRLVASQLESRWNAKLEELKQLQAQLAAMQETVITLSETDRQQIMALGRHFPALWFRDDCAVELKKKIIRILLREIMVDLKDASQELTFIIHWHGGCHTTFSMAKPLSGAVKYKTPAQDMDVIRNMAVRYDDGAIARVLSKLGRTTARGKRWTQTRVAYTRKLYGIPAVDTARRDPHILSLGQAVKYTGVSDTTLMKLINKQILPCHQIAPYAPLEIRKTDLETEPVRSILDHLKETGVLTLEGVSLDHQQSLFE